MSYQNSVPAVVPTLARLLKGEALHHQTITSENNGKQHRLGVTMHRLRHYYKFGALIQCHRDKDHPLQNHYFIAPSDLVEARQTAIKNGLGGAL